MLSHARPLSDIEFVAFDLETTGLFPVVNRLVEFGAARFRLDGRVLGTWEQLVDPECSIPLEVTNIHGITDAMVRGQPTLAQALGVPPPSFPLLPLRRRLCQVLLHSQPHDPFDQVVGNRLIERELEIALRSRIPCDRHVATRHLFGSNGPIRFVPTANSSIHNFWACGRSPGPKYGAIRN